MSFQDVVKSGSTVSNTGTASNTGTNSGAAGVSPLAIELYNMSNDKRKILQQSLKNIGFKIKVNGLYSDRFLAAYQTTQQNAQISASVLGKKFDSTFFNSYLVGEALAYGDSNATGSKNFKRTIISNTTEASALINAVMRDAIGRGATDSELKKYTKGLQQAQKANPLQFTDTAGSGYKQTGGLDSKEYLIQQIAGTDEAKANKVFSFYNAFKNAIGVP